MRLQATFTKTTDAIPVDQSVQIMTEYADINDVLLKSTSPLLEALKDGAALKHFRSLIVRTFRLYAFRFSH